MKMEWSIYSLLMVKIFVPNVLSFLYNESKQYFLVYTRKWNQDVPCNVPPNVLSFLTNGGKYDNVFDGDKDDNGITSDCDDGRRR
jgi:hypothetical protein